MPLDDSARITLQRGPKPFGWNTSVLLWAYPLIVNTLDLILVEKIGDLEVISEWSILVSYQSIIVCILEGDENAHLNSETIE